MTQCTLDHTTSLRSLLERFALSSPAVLLMSIQSSVQSAATSAASSAPSLTAKIDALEPDLRELMGKVTALDGKIAALEGKITEADEAHDASTAASLRIEASKLEARRDKLEGDMKQLRAMLIEYQHKENLLLEAQQRAQQLSASDQSKQNPTSMRQSSC